jgi:hypothetical protein
LSLVAPATHSNVMQAQAQTLVPLQGAGLEEAEGAYVQLPVRVALRRDASGRITPRVGKPSPDDVQEAMSYVRGLVARGEIGGTNGPLTTHSLETDDRGRKLLKRRAFKTAMS